MAGYHIGAIGPREVGTLRRRLSLLRRGLLVFAFPLLGAFGSTEGSEEEGAPEWADIVARYADVVYTMAFRLTGDDEEARDLAQDVMLKLHKGLRRYRKGNFEGWLYRLTVNAFRDRIRKRKRLREVSIPEHFERTQPGGHRVERRIQQRELRDVVQQALVKLPPTYREAIVLRDLEGRSYEEIGEVLGVPPGTVRSRIHRGREALRQLLESYVESGP